MELDEEFFFSLTPRQFYWLRERKNQVVQHSELLNGILASTFVNWSMNSPKKPHHPHDYMPTRAREKAKKEAAVPKRRWTRKKFGEELVAIRQQMSHLFVMKPAPPKPEPIQETVTDAGQDRREDHGHSEPDEGAG